MQFHLGGVIEELGGVVVGAVQPHLPADGARVRVQLVDGGQGGRLAPAGLF